MSGTAEPFRSLTLTAANGASLVLEAVGDDPGLAVWIAPPGAGDGPGVILSDDQVAALKVFLSRCGAGEGGAR